MSLLTPTRRDTKTPKRPTRAQRGERAEDTGPTAIHTNLAVTTTGTWAWYLLGDQAWHFRSLDERAGLLAAAQFRWSDLAGHKVQLRCSDRAVDYAGWARNLDRNSPRRLSTPEGHQGWADFLAAGQGYQVAAGLHTTDSYVGVRLGARVALSDLRTVAGARQSGERSVISALRATLTKVTETVARPGFTATPVPTRQLVHLLHASAALDVPVPPAVYAGIEDTATTADVSLAADQVHITALPYAPHVRVDAMREGGRITRYTTVLTVGAMRPRRPNRPGFEPWIAFARKLPFRTEWTAHLSIPQPQEMVASAKSNRRVAEDQREHYVEHKERPPARTEAQIAAAVRVEDEVINGTREEAARIFGRWRVAISGATADEVRANAATLISEYAQEQGITVEHTAAQAALYAEFAPGAPPAVNGGHLRVMPAAFAATALPNMGAGLGDGVGPVFGQVVSGGAGLVCIDPTWGPRNTKSGLIIVQGTLGSGKTTAAGVMALPMVLRGNRTVINDPSGPMARLCTVGSIAKVSRHINLASARPGVLNPYTLVFDPLAGDHPDPVDLAEAHADAAVERRDSIIDTFTALIDPKMIESMPGVLSRIEAAAQGVDAHYGQSPWEVVDKLAAMGETGAEIARVLTTVSTLKGGALIFPPRTGKHQEPTVALDTATLTVLTMRGLPTATPGAARSTWSRAERMAQPVLALAGKFAARAMYEDREPKLIITDELGQATGSGDGLKAAMTRGSLDSRKHNTGYMVMGQNPAHVDAIGEEIDNLAGLVLVGRMTSASTAKRAVRFLGVPDDCGYEQYPLAFPSGRGVPRQFLMRDWLGRVGVVQVDIGHLPELAAVLDTDPGAADQADLGTFEVPAW